MNIDLYDFFSSVFLSGRGLQEPFATHQEVCAVLFRITAEFEVQKPQKGNLLSSNLARRTLGDVRVHQKRPRTLRIKIGKSMCHSRKTHQCSRKSHEKWVFLSLMLLLSKSYSDALSPYRIPIGVFGEKMNAFGRSDQPTG